MRIENILKNRKETHGDFAEVSATSEYLHKVIEYNDSLSDEQKTSLKMILHKIARIVCGNPNLKDHWVDIEGYAKLVSDNIREIDDSPTLF